MIDQRFGWLRYVAVGAGVGFTFFVLVFLIVWLTHAFHVLGLAVAFTVVGAVVALGAWYAENSDL